ASPDIQCCEAGGVDEVSEACLQALHRRQPGGPRPRADHAGRGSFPRPGRDQKRDTVTDTHAAETLRRRGIPHELEHVRVRHDEPPPSPPSWTEDEPKLTADDS